MNYRIIYVAFLIILVSGVTFLAPVAGTVDKRNDLATHSTQTEIEAGNASAATDNSSQKTVIVRLTDHPEKAIQTTSHSTPVKAMQLHADRTQLPFREFSNTTRHVTIDHRFWLTNALLVTVDADYVPLSRLTAVENVERVHKNMAVHTTASPASARSTKAISGDQVVPISTNTKKEVTFTRALQAIDIPGVWKQYPSKGDGVRVAVIDSGVNPAHPDINIEQGNWACFEDCEMNPADPHDVYGHGTHVSATVTGEGANSKQLQIGTAPNATLLHAKAIGDDGRGSFASLLSSMEWSVKNDADIITMSLGISGQADVFIDPVQNAQSNGTVVIAAAGNEGPGTSSTPANIYPTIAVGSTNVKPAYPTDSAWRVKTGTVWDSSGGEIVTKDDWEAPPNSWPDQYAVPDITAPGNVIWSADNNIDRVSMCGDVDLGKHLACKKGTSMAAPHVAGVVALMMSNTDSELSPTDVEHLLTNTSTDLNTRKTRQGSGQVNATAAVSAALSTERPPAIMGNTKPTDPDGDGKYEDIDGNGSFDITDVSAFFNSYNDDRIKSNSENFDFNNDGEINIIDVSKLFSECGGCQA